MIDPLVPNRPVSQIPQCIITGCSLYSPDLGLYHLNGDLFELGDCYIFNANLTTLGCTEFVYPRTVTVATYFERRKVFVFHKAASVFNQAAMEYIA